MRSQRGFTMIEMMVVMGVIGLIIPAIFSIIFSILQQQSKIFALQEVKKQGDFVLNAMRTTIKNNAFSLHSASPTTDSNIVCSTAGSTNNSSPMYFRTHAGTHFNFNLSNDKVASASSTGPTIDLTTSKVRVQNLSITCTRRALFSPPIISVSFQIQPNTTSERPVDTASLTYQTKIQLKSY